jgi:hypothetical protein
MHGNIDTDPSRTTRGHGLQVCGPLLFDRGTKDAARSIEVQVVIVSADNGVPLGVATPAAVFYDSGRPNPEWMAVVAHLPSGVFKPGPARVTVLALVELVTGFHEPETWSEEVTIS